MKKFLISLFVFLPPLFLINDVDAACARFKAKIWTNNLQTNKKGIKDSAFESFFWIKVHYPTRQAGT